MRIFALSDLHVDYEPNMAWVLGLSRFDFVDDLLILAGDISHKRTLLDECLSAMTRRFRSVMFVPGNHDLWVLGEPSSMTSLEKFSVVNQIAANCGAITETMKIGSLCVVPLQGWYDYSFGNPGSVLESAWSDFKACRWPQGMGPAEVAAHFLAMNQIPPVNASDMRITVSHFLPRKDLIPSFVSARHRILDPVLGNTGLERQLRTFDPSIHVYGHSHINQSVVLDGIRYVNNAYGTPKETRITQKQMRCIGEI